MDWVIHRTFLTKMVGIFYEFLKETAKFHYG